MKKYFSKFLRSEEQLADLVVPKSTSGEFNIVFGNLLIGTLSYQNERWVFKYSQEFKDQDVVDVLIDFPTKDKIYEDDSLWPFFAHRIPGLGQPRVKRIVEKEELDSNNEFEMLSRFGRKSISNPFRLIIS